MSAKRERKVEFLELQTPAFIPGWGDTKTTIPSPNKTIKNLLMTLTPVGVEVEGTVGEEFAHFLIPYPNIKSIRFVKESKEE